DPPAPSESHADRGRVPSKSGGRSGDSGASVAGAFLWAPEGDASGAGAHRQSGVISSKALRRSPVSKPSGIFALLAAAVTGFGTHLVSLCVTARTRLLEWATGTKRKPGR